ncbi:MAG: ABC transporter ATP-binding protein [Flavobacteriales bacterium]|nr:ABC transporter ATP-binding protein [Flavobacteriales bacterium]
MLSTSALKFKYDNGPSFSFPDVQCGKGEHVLVIGESGTGKTTLLHLMAGMLKSQHGSVSIAGQNIVTMSGARLDKYRGQHVGIVFQTAHFVESLSVEDNLVMPQFLSGRKIDRTKAQQILKRLNLADKASSKPGKLSVGESQRAAIARAVINDPAVILADEPTSALDDKNANEVIHLLEEQAGLTGASLIIVTHDGRLKNHFQKRVEL